jgi:uncharacterized protein (TIGR03083 family)
MATTVAPDPQLDLRHVTELIRAEFDLADRYLGGLRPERWAGPTYCTAWDLTQLVSHLGSGAAIHRHALRAALDGDAPLDQAGRERIWDHFDGLAPEQLYPEFQASNRRYIDYLASLPPETGARLMATFAGEIPVTVFTLFRLSELSLHSWDARVAFDPPTRLLPASAAAVLPTMLRTLARRSNAEARGRLTGSSFGISLTAPSPRQLTLSIADAVAWQDQPVSSPTATLTLSAEAFLRLCAGRLPLAAAEVDGDVVIDGDRDRALHLNALFPGF